MPVRTDGLLFRERGRTYGVRRLRNLGKEEIRYRVGFYSGGFFSKTAPGNGTYILD